MNLLIIAGFVGPQEIIIILIIVLLLFGGRKIPELMKGLGKGMREFKKQVKRIMTKKPSQILIKLKNKNTDLNT